MRSFWNAEAGQTRILIRLKEQMPAPDKSRIFREATAAAVEAFGPTSYLTGLSFLMTRTTEAIIATQWGTFLWSAIGILVMLTLAFRSVVLAFLAIMPTLLSVALVLGLMGWLGSSSTWRRPWWRASRWGFRSTTRFTACSSSTASARRGGSGNGSSRATA